MVCTGNICRSTMAQQVLDEDAAAVDLPVVVDSAGISDEETGNPIDPRAARVLREGGHGVPTHRARQVTGRELGRWDLVLAMTRFHMDALRRLARRSGISVARGGPLGRAGVTDLRMYREFDPDAEFAGFGDAQDLDVPDPWYGGHSEFLRTLHVVERVSPSLVEYLQARADATSAVTARPASGTAQAAPSGERRS